MDQKAFDTKHARLAALREESRGHDDTLRKAEAVVGAAKQTADAARVDAVVDPAAAPAAAAAEKALEAALENRDRLEARGRDLGAAIQRLESELSAAAGAVRAATLEAAAKKAREELVKAKPTIEAALAVAACLWALEKRGPFTGADLGSAVAAAVGADLEALRNAGLAEYERLSRDANAPLRALAQSAFNASEGK